MLTVMLRIRDYKPSLMILLLTVISGVFAISCSNSSSPSNNPGDDFGLFSNNVIVVDGLSRTYEYYIPDSLGFLPCPLVILLHGGGVHTEDMTGESGFKAPYKVWMAVADTEKFIVVYPQGANGAYDKPAWNDCRGDAIVNPDVNDVKFIDTLITRFNDSYNIDTNRIYVSGTSNGGLMTLRLAVELSNRLAAVAPVVAAMPAESECGSPTNPLSVLFMNGTADSHLPYEGGTVSNPPNPDHGTVLSAEESVAYWVEHNKTDTIPIITNFPDINTEDDSHVIRYEFRNGTDGAEVVLYKVIGGGHAEPSIQEQYSALFELMFGKQNHDIEMAHEIWAFFKSKTRH